ncbi:MAG: hypothetical protein ACJ78X_19280 [Myxococcales bacterium]
MLPRIAILTLTVGFAARAEDVATARKLEEMRLPVSAFFFYGEVLRGASTGPGAAEAAAAVQRLSDALHDEMFGPNLLAKLDANAIAALPNASAPRVHAALALLQYRAGKFEAAQREADAVPKDSDAFPQAQYVAGLLAQRTAPERGVAALNGVLSDGRSSAELRELSHLALGRTLYGMHRYGEASAEYAKLPRFSRHWDEALFEGAYADLMRGDPGGALGKLQSLHSPHLSDEFAPESENLAAIVYHQHCLWPEVRTALQRFDRIYLPMRDQVRAVLSRDPSPASLLAALDGKGDVELPKPVRHHLRKNERVESMLAYAARIDDERRRVRDNEDFARSELGTEVLDVLAQNRDLTNDLLAKFVKGRLADLAHLIDVLEGEKDVIAFEATKGEKGFLERDVDAKKILASEALFRPQQPSTGHEYWAFDGEYWPDEIGYYQATIKDACPATWKEPEERALPATGGAPQARSIGDEAPVAKAGRPEHAEAKP